MDPLSLSAKTITTEGSDDNIQAAIDLLQGLGVRNLCLDSLAFADGDSSKHIMIPLCDDNDITDFNESTEWDWNHFITNAVGALLMVLLVALISGLFLGLLTLDVMDLQIIIRASTDDNEREYASQILPVVKDRHRLLVTLLIVNALAYESLPLFLDQLVPNWVAVLLSTTLILVFGEILPSGVFMGPNQLYLGSMFLPTAKFFLYVLKPIAVPLARILDIITETKEDDHTDSEYNRDELTALIQIQHERQQKATRGKKIIRPNYYKYDANNNSNPSWSDVQQEIIETAEERTVDQLHPPLHQREVDIMQGALQLKTNSAMDVYTPWSHVYAVADNLVLDKATITEIYSHGYSRVPVYRYNKADPSDNTNILGFLITRQLMLIEADDERLLSTLPLQRPVCISPKKNLIGVFDTLQKDGLLLTFVCGSPRLANMALDREQPVPYTAGLMGIITLVDVMESILQNRIYDEGDIRDRDRAVAVLQQWASDIVKRFIRRTAEKNKKKRQASLVMTPPISNEATVSSEETPLLSSGEAEPYAGARYASKMT